MPLFKTWCNALHRMTERWPWRSRAAARAPLMQHAPIQQPVQHVEMQGQTFVSNLFWQPLSNARNAGQEARAFGVQNGWVWNVVRSGARAQAGFAECSPDLQTLKGTLSLAALLAAQLGDAWLGIFKLSADRYVCVAVHERWIIPGFDVMCNAEQAMQLWSEATHLYAFDPSACFAPPELGLAAIERDIAPLLAARQWYAACRIKRLTWYPVHPKRMAAGAVLALAGLGIGGYWVFAAHAKWGGARLAARMRHPQPAQPPRLREAHVSSSMPGRTYPWTHQVSAETFAQICTTAIGRLPLNLAGWHFDRARCEGRTVTAQLKRQKGASIAALVNAAAHWKRIRPVFDGHDQALLHLPLASPAGSARDVLPPAEQLIAGFVSHFQRYNLQPDLKPVAHPAAFEAEMAHSTLTSAQDWEQLNFSVQTLQAPIFHFTRLAQQGVNEGVRIRTITVTLEQAMLKWHIEGALYVQRPL